MTPRAEAWIRQARSDLDAARVTAGQRFHTQACYLAGQAAEKALKALLVAAGITPPHSRSLQKLVEVIEEQGLSLPALAELQLNALIRMNSSSRYPQGEEAPADLFDRSDSQLALTTASAVLAIAESQLKP